jgi:hypothetical protein
VRPVPRGTGAKKAIEAIQGPPVVWVPQVPAVRWANGEKKVTEEIQGPQVYKVHKAMWAPQVPKVLVEKKAIGEIRGPRAPSD